MVKDGKSVFGRRVLVLAGDSLCLDAAVIDALEDLEVTLFTPSLVPGVGTEPVLPAVLDSVAEHFDRVAIQVRSASVLVNAAILNQEVKVEIEFCLEGAVQHQLALHGLTPESLYAFLPKLLSAERLAPLTHEVEQPGVGLIPEQLPYLLEY